MSQSESLPSLAEPFSRIFTNQAEAEWAFDLLRDTAKRLGIHGAYDARFALTLAKVSGGTGLHLNFGGWLVLGFHGPVTPPKDLTGFENLSGLPHRVDLALLAERIAWDERFDSLPFARKEGEPEVRSYHLPLDILRPLTADLAAAYESTLDFIAHKFKSWKRAIHWQRHNPEIAEALFNPEQRERVLLGGVLNEPELRYERHLTAFYQDISEEREGYEVQMEGEGLEEWRGGGVEAGGISYELQSLGGTIMYLDAQKVNQIVARLKQYRPNWSFADPFFIQDEIQYKQTAIAKARELLSEVELKRLIEEETFDEFVKRLVTIGQSTNLLFLGVPKSGDLNILYHSKLDKPTFCKAVFDLLYGIGPSPDRLEHYVNYLKAEQLPNKWTFPTYFLFLCHPTTEMFVKPQTTKWFFEFIGHKDKFTPIPTRSAYAALLEIAQELKEALQEFGPRDMVDIQSVIWVCRSVKPSNNDNTISGNTKLAEPFSQIFINRMLAEGHFDDLQKVFKSLKIEGHDDQRFALMLVRCFGTLNLQLMFGDWEILTFRGRNSQRERVTYSLFVEQVKNLQLIDKLNLVKEYDFKQENNEPRIAVYGLPLELTLVLLLEPSESTENSFNNLLELHEATLNYISERFQNYGGCPWRDEYHVPEIAEAVFDLEKRTKLLDEGLSTDIKVAEVENIEPDVILEPVYTLTKLAEDTGLDEAELARWVRAIERKGQAILYGPPGTGKTFIAEKLARHLTGGGDGFWELVQFHPAYAYEDFIQGIRPESQDGLLTYPLKPGRFLEFCAKAATRQNLCVLIIDEINRANLSRVFGELMYLLEYRDKSIPLAGGGAFKIPANVRLIGAMNTADRSIALVDHALRRRFAFIALYPNYDLLSRYHQTHQTDFPIAKLIAVLKNLNRAIGDRHYEVGVTFFLQSNLTTDIEDIWRMELEPYLEEYFFDRPEKLESFRWEKVKSQIL